MLYCLFADHHYVALDLYIQYSYRIVQSDLNYKLHNCTTFSVATELYKVTSILSPDRAEHRAGEPRGRGGGGAGARHHRP